MSEKEGIVLSLKARKAEGQPQGIAVSVPPRSYIALLTIRDYAAYGPKTAIPNVK